MTSEYCPCCNNGRVVDAYRDRICEFCGGHGWIYHEGYYPINPLKDKDDASAP